MNDQDLLHNCERIAREAGAAIMEVYQRARPVDVTRKDDDSPITEADLAAHGLIVAGLRRLTPALPVLSEESEPVPWPERATWRRYWLVDPLDGTKEFIGGNGEFTVNIALVDEGVPVLGVVYAPARGLLYGGAREGGAFVRKGEEAARAIRSIPVEQGRPLRVVASRRHGSAALDPWLASLRARFPDVELVNMGSSLKICLVAEGRADAYPRLAPTSEWDTAAAQAVLEAAGGSLVDADFRPHRYNRRESLLNPWFFAFGDPGYPWPRLDPADTGPGGS